MVSKDVDSESMLVVTVCERKSSTALKVLRKTLRASLANVYEFT